MKIGDTYWLTVLHLVGFAFTIVAGIAFFSVPRMGRKDYMGIGIIVFLFMLIDGLGMIGAHIFHRNMNLLNNISSFITLPVGIIFYRRRIEGFSKTTVAIIILLFVTFAFWNLFFYQGIHGINSYTDTLASIGFMGLSVYYFASLFFQHSVNHTVRGMFWINSGILIYYAGTFFVNLLIEYLLKFLHNDLIVVWMIRNSLGLVMFALLIYGLIKVRREYLSHIILI